AHTLDASLSDADSDSCSSCWVKRLDDVSAGAGALARVALRRWVCCCDSSAPDAIEALTLVHATARQSKQVQFICSTALLQPSTTVGREDDSAVSDDVLAG
ncbi:MAG: hypothetical protein SGPRY_010421, partial [Prymnesium sp.]